MFDRLDDLLIRYEELLEELNSPDVAMDQNRFRKLMKEQADLTPLVDAYKEYKKANQDVEDSLALLEEESDEEMRDMAKEELADAKKRIEEMEQQLKILLLPKDPNDDKNVMVEIRAGAAATKQPFLPRSFTECMCILRRATAGRRSLSASMRTESEVSRRLCSW